MAGTSPEDVLEEFGLTSSQENISKQIELTLSTREQKIYDVLNFEPMHVDVLATETGMSTQQLLVELLALEFKDAVRQLPGKYFMRLH